ncbi:MAG TPA: FkbM family methyltransferase [Opitutaceae bacterium]|nr:FkbM family methyltransferase [Opitutaceae bacterium]
MPVVLLVRPKRSPIERLGGHWRDLFIRWFPIHARSRSGFVVPIWDRTQRRVYERVFVEGMFPLDGHRNLVSGTSPVVLDIGAHTGLFALSVADRWPEARIHLFEPVPRLAKRIAELARLNGLEERWRIEQAAVDTSSGIGTLFTTRTQLGASLLREKAVEVGLRRAIDVRTVALADYCRAHQIEAFDVVKLDAEGHELPILRAALPIIATARLIFVRVFPPRSTREAVSACLAPYGFEEVQAEPPGGAEVLFVRRL